MPFSVNDKWLKKLFSPIGRIDANELQVNSCKYVIKYNTAESYPYIGWMILTCLLKSEPIVYDRIVYCAKKW